jgi:hypothetical protein
MWMHLPFIGFHFLVGVLMPLFVLFFWGLLRWKAYPSIGTFPCLLFPLPFPCPLPFPRFSISLLRHGTSFIQLLGPYLHVTTWFIMRGNVKFFRPFFWALRKSCQPFEFVPSPVGMCVAIEFKPPWCFTSWGPLAISYSWIPFVFEVKGVVCLLLSLRSCSLQHPMWHSYMTPIIFILTIVYFLPHSTGCNKPQKD